MSCQKAATILNQCSLISSDRSNKWIVANGEENKKNKLLRDMNTGDRYVSRLLKSLVCTFVLSSPLLTHRYLISLIFFSDIFFSSRFCFVFFFFLLWERQLRRWWWWWLFSVVVVVAVYILSIKNYGQKLAELSYWFLMKVRTLNCCLMSRTGRDGVSHFLLLWNSKFA